MSPVERGSTLGSHYVVDELIGQGGMGVVYRGRDLRLGREVALKILSTTELGGQADVGRFTQEARAASALNHPSIVTIYDVGANDHVHFIAEELVVGVTLRDRLAAGPVPLAEALDIGIQVASALSAAHAAGIVHRDIKPENLMIRADGLVKVLDFGLAKVAQTSAEAMTMAATATGVVMGTVSYMSPEQARGQRVDGRSDIFSLGVVLYEMLAGRAPFARPTAADSLIAVLQQDPAPLEQTSPGIPPACIRLVSKALRKDPDERYQTVRDLLADLKVERAALTAPTTATAAIPAKRRTTATIAITVAALLLIAAASWVGLSVFGRRAPTLTDKDTILLTEFTNKTGDAMFDGGTLRQALMVQLQQTPFLNIFPDPAIATTLAMMARTPDERITGDVAREICQRLRLSAMISGAIARLGQHYVLTLEAIDAQSGRIVAAAQGEAADAEHVLQVLGTATATLRERLGESLSTLQKYDTPIEQATTSSLEALKAYSEGLRFLQHEDGVHGVPFFVRAVELDPDFVAAYDNGAWAQVIAGNGPKGIEFATEAYRRRARANNLEQMSATATYHHFATGDWEEEIRIADIWTRLFPNDSTPLTVYTLDYPLLGRLSETPEAARSIIRLNANIAQGYRFLISSLVPLQQYDEAERVIAQARTLGLDNIFNRRAELTIAVARDDRAGIDRSFETIARGNSPTEATAWRARLAATAGRWREARELFQGLIPTTPPGGRAPLTATSIELAVTAALLGRCDAVSASPIYATSRVLGPQVGATLIGPDGGICGDPAAADAFAVELARRFPTSTPAREVALPQLRAAIALAKNKPDEAITALRSIRAQGNTAAALGFYLRGYANLRGGRPSEALTNFQMVIDHRAWSATSPVYPLAELGLARAQAHSGNNTAARSTYTKLLDFWKDADVDLPVYVAAKSEAAALGR